MTVIMTVVRMGPFFPRKVRHGQTSTPPTIMQLVSTETLLGMRLLGSLSSRRSISAVAASTMAPRSPAQRRARSVRVPCGGKGSLTLLPSASPASDELGTSSLEVASPGWVPGPVSGWSVLFSSASGVGGMSLLW